MIIAVNISASIFDLDVDLSRDVKRGSADCMLARHDVQAIRNMCSEILDASVSLHSKRRIIITSHSWLDHSKSDFFFLSYLSNGISHDFDKFDVIVDFNNHNNFEDLDGLTQLLIIYEYTYIDNFNDFNVVRNQSR